MPPRRAPHDEQGAARRPAKRRAAEEEDQDTFDDQDSFDDQEPEDAEEPGDAGEPEREPEDGARHRAPAPAPARTRARPRARGRGRDQGGRVTAADAAQKGVRSLADLIGKQPEGVTAVQPTEDGWLVGVEVIEDQRVPSSADILAVYEAELDGDGALKSYRRTARYARGKGDTSGGSLNDQ
jgi:gas vesicle protein GvpO